MPPPPSAGSQIVTMWTNSLMDDMKQDQIELERSASCQWERGREGIYFRSIHEWERLHGLLEMELKKKERERILILILDP